jgi:hypothetical protein
MDTVITLDLEIPMRSTALITLALAALALSACATSYQADSWTGGFSETQLGPNIYRVSFRGNGFTSRNRAEDLTLLRSAELTLRSGYTHFVIVDGRQSVDVSQVSTPSVTTGTQTFGAPGGVPTVSTRSVTTGGQALLISKPSTSNTIVLYRGTPGGGALAYDARFLFDSLAARYEVSATGR